MILFSAIERTYSVNPLLVLMLSFMVCFVFLRRDIESRWEGNYHNKSHCLISVFLCANFYLVNCCVENLSLFIVTRCRALFELELDLSFI